MIWENIFNIRHTTISDFYVIFCQITCNASDAMGNYSVMMEHLRSGTKPRLDIMV